MKYYILPVIAAALLGSAACNNPESGTSTPIDSTVKEGTAPVDYESGTPATTIDTTMQGRDQMRSDTMGQSNRTQGNVAPGNTTDRRTTSGSAQGSTTEPGK